VAAFYLDHDVGHEVALLLRGAGHDATTAQQSGLRAATDDEHFLTAAEQARILVTHNGRDYLLLHRAWLRWSMAWRVTREHAGILLIPQPPMLPIDEAARDLSSFAGSGRPLTNELYRRRPPGLRPAWERWRPGDRWTRR
jgi:hypothetical protein